MLHFPVRQGLGEKLTVAPAGTPAVAVNTIGVEKLPFAVVPKVTAAVAGPPQVIVVAVVALKLNPDTAGVIVKFAFEMSKKMLPTASTFTLAVVVAILGMVNNSDPSLAVLAKHRRIC